MKQGFNLLINTTELAQLLQQQTKYLTIVNTNFGLNYKTGQVRPADEWDEIFKQERIPTARHINLAKIADKSQGLPNMLPTLEAFTKTMRDLDIGKNDHVVCYGDESIVGACRALWMFKVFGFPNVQVLNGTFNKWKKEGNPVEKGEETWLKFKRERKEDDFIFSFNKSLVANMEQIRKFVNENKLKEINLVDARPPGIFEGKTPDPKGMRVGHVPGGKNLPFGKLINMENDDTFKNQEELDKIIKDAGVNLGNPTVAMCASGMTSSVLYLGFCLSGCQDLALYDGSWAEWSKIQDNPVATGPSETH